MKKIRKCYYCGTKNWVYMIFVDSKGNAVEGIEANGLPISYECQSCRDQTRFEVI